MSKELIEPSVWCQQPGRSSFASWGLVYAESADFFFGDLYIAK